MPQLFTDQHNPKERKLSDIDKINRIIGAAILRRINEQGIKLQWLADKCFHPNNLGRQLRGGNIHSLLLLRISMELKTDFFVFYSIYQKNPNNITEEEQEGVHSLYVLLNDVEKIDEPDGIVYLDKLLNYLDKLSKITG